MPVVIAIVVVAVAALCRHGERVLVCQTRAEQAGVRSFLGTAEHERGGLWDHLTPASFQVTAIESSLSVLSFLCS